MLKIDRSAAYLDGRVFRGTADGRVLAYDANNGQAPVGDHDRRSQGRGIGSRFADCMERHGVRRKCRWRQQGVKGRMYALDAATGKIEWEFLKKGVTDLVVLTPSPLMFGVST